MAKMILHLHKSDAISVVPPDNGEASWLKVCIGKSIEAWLSRDQVKRLRDALTEGLATEPVAHPRTHTRQQAAR